MSKRFELDKRMGPNSCNKVRMQSEFLKRISDFQEYTNDFHSDGIPAQFVSSVTKVLQAPVVDCAL